MTLNEAYLISQIAMERPGSLGGGSYHMTSQGIRGDEA